MRVCVCVCVRARVLGGRRGEEAHPGHCNGCIVDVLLKLICRSALDVAIVLDDVNAPHMKNSNQQYTSQTTRHGILSTYYHYAR